MVSLNIFNSLYYLERVWTLMKEHYKRGLMCACFDLQQSVACCFNMMDCTLDKIKTMKGNSERNEWKKISPLSSFSVFLTPSPPPPHTMLMTTPPITMETHYAKCLTSSHYTITTNHSTPPDNNRSFRGFGLIHNYANKISPLLFILFH